MPKPIANTSLPRQRKRDPRVHIFGIRHHGPGSSRSLQGVLANLKPDLLLVEGPPDANGWLHIAGAPQMQAPVALLVYAADQVALAGYYPFAEFSPEWLSLRYAFQNGVPIRFIDMPQTHRFALMRQQMATAQLEAELAKNNPAASAPIEIDAVPTEPDIHQDPLYWLARAAGYNDGERWWDHMVEQRRDKHNDENIFAAILAAMTALREATPQMPDQWGHLREAFMRKAIRGALTEGFQRIAVICGAWHTPALAYMLPAKHDNMLTANLPSTPVKTAWVPWTHGRLVRGNGYGAGVYAPGWYHFLHSSRDDVAVGWITHVAHMLRAQDIDASPAQVIDAVRLAESLAVLRDRPAPGLPELNEAILAVLCFGNPQTLRMVYPKLMVGERMGRVPDHAPTTPLQNDLAQQQATLALVPAPEAKSIDLDLRESLDLGRSHLLHRLDLLGITWGILVNNQRSPFAHRPPANNLRPPIPRPGPRPTSNRATPPPENNDQAAGAAREKWSMAWQPELAIKLIEANLWGSTVQEAAINLTKHSIGQTEDLGKLTRLIDRVLLADLPEVIDTLMVKVQARAALSNNNLMLLDAISPLVRVLRYGNVRQIDIALLEKILGQLVIRACVSLPLSCLLLSDDMATEMVAKINSANSALHIHNDAGLLQHWYSTLTALPNMVSNNRTVHPLVAGRTCRLLFESNQYPLSEVKMRMNFAASGVNVPLYTAQWIEGFIRGSDMSLLYDDGLWSILSTWLRGIREEVFTAILPTLRRTFATFSTSERHKIGQRAKQGRMRMAASPAKIDAARGDQVLPIMARLLGLNSGNESSDPTPQRQP
jgi:hypothetical protein